MNNNDLSESVNILKAIHITELKGIKDCTITIDCPLIAIMGVNGIGKTTIIHALACSFNPYTKEKRVDRRRFYEFFPPTNNKSWKDSRFDLEIASVTKDKITGDIKEVVKTIPYSKAVDRWAPKYVRQPQMDVYYVGISSCCPEIEMFKDRRAHFITSEKTDKASKKIVEAASSILNKNYESMLNNDIRKKNKNMIGVRTKDNIQYSALSMGAGEQRLFEMLRVLYSASPYSLLLIDEIDLLMHSDALKKMIKVMSEIANQRHLQIVFTTHSLVMNDLKEYVSIKYLDRLGDNTIVYDGISSIAWGNMTGMVNRPMTVYVEDDLSVAIIRDIAQDVGVNGKVSIHMFGSIENAFTLASAMIIKEENVDNQLIVTDGDKYTTLDQKQARIKKSLSGTEAFADESRERAVSIITQFVLPPQTKPEEYLVGILKRSVHNNEIVNCAKGINAVGDSHDWLNMIIERTNCNYSDIINQCKLADSDEWSIYTQNVREWIVQRKDI